MRSVAQPTCRVENNVRRMRKDTIHVDYDRNAAIPDTTADHTSAVDAGLRDHMLRVYNYMALALA